MNRTITICGSSLYADLMAVIAWEFEKLGNIVHRVNYLPGWYAELKGFKSDHHFAEQENLKSTLDQLHIAKIDNSDVVFICNVNGYIGESTRNEIEYCRFKGKKILYLDGPDNELNQIINPILVTIRKINEMNKLDSIEDNKLDLPDQSKEESEIGIKLTIDSGHTQYDVVTKNFETIQCECGKFTPVEFAYMDDDGVWHCPECFDSEYTFFFNNIILTLSEIIDEYDSFGEISNDTFNKVVNLRNSLKADQE